MHEASIAIDLIALIEEQAQLHGATRVSRVVVNIGTLSSVVPEALLAAWDAAAAQSVAQHASLEIQRVAAKAICPEHGEVLLELQKGIRCPICDSPTPQIVAGEELELDSLELE